MHHSDHRSYRDISANVYQKTPQNLNKKPSQISNPQPVNLKNYNQENSQTLKQSHQTIPPQEKDPVPECFVFVPDTVRRMSSRILGEEVESTLDDLIVKKINGEETIVIKGVKCKENEELFNRSSIAFAHVSQSSNQILEHILKEGFLNLTIKPMGGLLHLITFDTLEDKKAMIESKWLDRWFMEVRDINPECGSRWKETWIRIYGVPLSGWGYDNFFKIGCIFGRVQSVEYSSFEYARVLLITDCLFNINCQMMIELEGKHSKVFVSEERVNIISQSNQDDQKKVISSPSSSEDDDYRNTHDNGGMESEDSACKKNDEDVLTSNEPTAVIGSKEDSRNSFPRIMQKAANHKESTSAINSPITSLSSTVPCQIEPHPINLPYPSPKKKKTVTFNLELAQTQCNTSPTPHQTSPRSSPKILQPNKAAPTSSPNPVLALTNKYHPLLRPSPNNSSSSSQSGPIYPPGFENTIPNNIKKIHERKRVKKILKKRKKASLECSIPAPAPTISPTNVSIEISATSTLKIAKKLDFQFSGTTNQLESRIDQILHQQRIH